MSLDTSSERARILSSVAAFRRSQTRPLRILYLSTYWPRNHPSCGGEWRAVGVGRALRELGTVETVVVRSESEDEERANKASCAFDVCSSVKVTPRSEPGLWRKIRWALDPRISYPHGWGVDTNGSKSALQRIEDFDLIWFGNFRTANMFENWYWPRSVLDVDDLPSSVERSDFRTARKLRTRLLQIVRISSWKRREKVLGDRFTVIAACSDTDKAYLRRIGCRGPIHVIPNGFERPAAEPVRRPAVPPRIGFIGPFSHPPNLDGIRWFVKECWPRIKRCIPDARLRIVGEGSEGPLRPVGPDIDGLGWVSDIVDEIGTWSLMTVPLRIGAGTRVKIAQGFSLKCPIVSTSLGAYGYDVQDGVEMDLVDTAKSFADACIRAIQYPIEANEMANRAWEQFLQKWTWDAIAPRVRAAAEECLRLSADLEELDHVTNGASQGAEITIPKRL
jgi:polysaccharide biosynthesis protein PslH